MFRRSYCCFSLTNPKSSLYSTQTRSNSKPEFLNSSIKQLVQRGESIQAVELCIKLCNNGFKPDNFIFPYILKASSQLKDPFFGFQFHNQIIKTGFDSNVFVANSLILFYGKLGHLQNVQYLFDKIPQKNIVSWTAMISAYTQNHRFDLAIELFRYMQIVGVKANSFTMATLLPSFCDAYQLIQVHSFLIKHGNLVSWNALCSGYNQNGDARESLKLFAEMQKCGAFRPDSFTVVTALCSCSALTLVRQGKEIHGYLYRAGLESCVLVSNGLIDMYGKCGFLEIAKRVFNRMWERDVGSWTALIMCYGIHGQGLKAIEIFEQMKKTKSVSPNSVTLLAILTACSHSCLVEDGFKYFQSMTDGFGIEPTVKHYVCMVDMLGRAGLLEEALKFINRIPQPVDFRVWEALLGCATIQGDVEIAEIAAKSLMEMGTENPEVCVQVANIYAKSSRWDDVAKSRGAFQFMKLQKSPGVSVVQTLQE
ncbi:hypothetical protein MKW94_006515 [Papaver nudicaule]|uniref:Pentatricopeptide repeat-containing protein n=1 Tax=Papaver nudicaule TaxID=74823 RepID=A0AA42B3Y0_PAPNU|nr:hypothetical protein [Papaver nudicaule]